MIETLIVVALVALISLICYQLGFKQGHAQYQRERCGAIYQQLQRMDQEDW